MTMLTVEALLRENDRLRVSLDTAIALLRSLEWSHLGCDDEWRCPVCQCMQPKSGQREMVLHGEYGEVERIGHSPTCKLATLVRG